MGVKLSQQRLAKFGTFALLRFCFFLFFYSARNPYAAQESQGQRKRPDHHGGQVFSSLQHWFSRVLFSNKLSPQAHQCVARATEKGRKKTFYV